MKLELGAETFEYSTPFSIKDYVFTNAEVVVVTLREGAYCGWGEASGVYYHGETPRGMIEQIEAVRSRIEMGVDRAALRELLPPGGARNAVDAALWDLEAKQHGQPVWELAGTQVPRVLRTTFTVSTGTPQEMADAALQYRSAKAIKLKITDEDPVGCVRAVRAARPDVWLGVDANQALSRATLEKILPDLIASGVRLIEQPVPRGQDGDLEGLDCPIAIAADESVQTSADLAGLLGRYHVVNIKLDKCGGLTEGLAMARGARRLGLNVMVGCMSGTSLAIAPAFVLAQLCDLVDLDGPVFLREDREPPATYNQGGIWCPEELWGAPG